MERGWEMEGGGGGGGGRWREGVGDGRREGDGRKQLNGILFDKFRLVDKVPKSMHCSPHLVLC